MDGKYDFTKEEPQAQKFWEDEEIYRFDSENEKGRPVFSIDTPPPTVSGSLHIGHIFSYTQAEIAARYKRMTGYRVYYPFGFDDNGLPTERLTEKKLKIRAKDLPRREFSEKCLQVSEEYEREFKTMWKRLGFSADWTNAYRTVSDETKKLSQKLFLDLVRKKKAYQKESPVLWCPECRTAVAQAELETKECESQFYYLKFILQEEERERPDGTGEIQTGRNAGRTDQDWKESGGAFLPVATTRPELLCGCVCVFVNPDDERYRDLIGRNVLVPIYGNTVPVLSNEEADREKGTGAVMCATFGDMTDAEWYEKYRLPLRSVLREDGCFEEGIAVVGGKNVKAARTAAAEALKDGGWLLKTESLTHLVAVHERCGKETEIRLSRQWYIDILSEKEELLKAADGINWHPDYMKKRYQTWVSGLKWDWCISRQRYFGVPFPVWYCKKCGRPVFADEEDLPVDPAGGGDFCSAAAQRNAFECGSSLSGMNAEGEDGLKTGRSSYDGTGGCGPRFECSCGCTEFEPETAVFDTWATSSITPFLHEKNVPIPMGMRSQAHEIIRTWAFYTVVRSLYHAEKLPWKDIMISGFVLAKPGEKISKSKNNAKDAPMKLIETHSADAIRYWAAGAKLGTDTFFSEEELKVSKRFLTKLWNASRYCLMQLADFGACMRTEEMLPVDRYFLYRTAQVQKEVKKLLDQYEIGQARLVLDAFFWDEFCGYYIEIGKERLYQPEKHGEMERRSGQSAVYSILYELIKMYAPYVPHMTEAVYQEYFRMREPEKSLHLAQWGVSSGGGLPDPGENRDAESILRFGEILKNTIDGIRKEKAEKGLSMKGEVERAVIICPSGLVKYFKKTEGDLLACTNAKEIIYRS